MLPAIGWFCLSTTACPYSAFPKWILIWMLNSLPQSTHTTPARAPLPCSPESPETPGAAFQLAMQLCASNPICSLLELVHPLGSPPCAPSVGSVHRASTRCWKNHIPWMLSKSLSTPKDLFVCGVDTLPLTNGNFRVDDNKSCSCPLF